MNNIYLDYAATTPVRKEILDAYKKLLDLSYANSDSIHELGSEAGKYLSAARKQISTLLIALGGKRNDEQPIPTTTTNATPVATANDWS
jgi:cysteine sulfinate desulfinase/cysteine desulfurase-like protein